MQYTKLVIYWFLSADDRLIDLLIAIGGLQYGGDQDDKQWLHEKQHMPATGGRTYLLILEDIRDLTQTDEYR